MLPPMGQGRVGTMLPPMGQEEWVQCYHLWSKEQWRSQEALLTEMHHFYGVGNLFSIEVRFMGLLGNKQVM